MRRNASWRRTLIESLAVVASILLAFAIDAWWDETREGREERESLLVLASDLDDSVEQLAEYEDYVGRIASANLIAYEALSSDVPPATRDSIADLLVTSSLRLTMSLPSAAYTDLVSTGGLRLIRDRNLRNALVRFYQLMERLQTVAEKNSTMYTDGYLTDVLVGEGLLIRRPNRYVESGPGASDAVVRDRLGAGFRHPPDPLWEFSADSREWDRLRSALLQNGRGLLTNVGIATQLRSAATQLRDSVDSYLSGGAL